MNLFNNIFNADTIEIIKINKNYLRLILVILLLFAILFLIKKDYYYENNLLINNDNIFLLVDKKMINEIKKAKTILVNKIENDYSINKIIDQGDICYVDISLYANIENILDNKYQILLGKETVFEYIIRIIKKIS